MQTCALPWLALSLLHHNPSRVTRALESSGDPERALADLVGPDAGGYRRRAMSLARRLPGMGIGILTLAAPDYPELLRQIPDPPPVLFIMGSFGPDDDPAVALVGSRQATPYGTAVARYLGEELGAGGVTVVSGLARGIDAAAHEGVLTSAHGRAVAVLGCGLDRIYPPEHRRLAAAVARRGALISEFPPKTAPLARHFPRRNRLISGLSRSVVVVEAAAGSGSLITARMALEQGREVCAVPGPVTSPASLGTHGLLREGARPVATALDVVAEFPAQVRAALARRQEVLRELPPPDLDATEAELLALLDPAEAKGVDALAEASGLSVPALVAALLGLELRGLARALPGARYVRQGWTAGG